MADEPERKIEALKKVYAEIMLNSSKEAAARIMAAEHKARYFEHQLVSLKEESLSMLHRLKDELNSMVMEAEAKSLKQQMKIDELEAQLNEAEGIIVDLRSELNQVQEQFDIEKRTWEKPLNEHIVVTNEPVQECVLQDNVTNSSMISQVPDSKSELENYDKKVASVHPVLLNKILHTVNVNYSESHVDEFHASNDEFSSIIMNNRETDLHKNGCTQRIRAFEGNLSKVRLPTSPSEDKYVSNVQPLIYAEKAMSDRQFSSDEVNSCLEPLRSSETYKNNVKNIPLGWLKQRRSSSKPLTTRSRRSFRKNTKYKEAIDSLHSTRKTFRKTELKASHFPLKRCSSGLNVEVVEIPIGLIELNPKNKFFRVLESGDLISTSENNAACASSNKSHDTLDDSLLESELVDVPISEGFGSNHCQLSRADKFLKFTFQRKRRKNVLGKIDENIPHNRVPLKRLDNPTEVSVFEIDISKVGSMERMEIVK